MCVVSKLHLHTWIITTNTIICEHNRHFGTGYNSVPATSQDNSIFNQTKLGVCGLKENGSRSTGNILFMNMETHDFGSSQPSDINKLEQKIQARGYICMSIYKHLCVWVRLLETVPQIWTASSESLPSFEISIKSTMGVIILGCLNRCFHLVHSHVPAKHEMFAFSLPTWWLLNLFLVSFDKPLCSQRDIPLTQPLVIVYTSSHQSRRALSGFQSNIHFASEVQYRKWLDHLSFFLLPPPSPQSFCHANIIWHRRRDTMVVFLKKIIIQTFFDVSRRSTLLIFSFIIWWEEVFLFFSTESQPR